MGFEQHIVVWCHAEVARLCADARARVDRRRAALSAVPLGLRTGAANLLAAGALRDADLALVQARLTAIGLARLDATSPTVLADLEAIQAVLCALSSEPIRWKSSLAAAVDGEQTTGERVDDAAAQLFGSAPERPPRATRIMVTLPTEAAKDRRLVATMLGKETDLVRINCAHDDAPAWRAMARHVREAATARGRPCRILMDLAGPKIRTAAVAPGPRVQRVKLKRDARGKSKRPLRLGLFGASKTTKHGLAPGALRRRTAMAVPVEDGFAAELRPGDAVSLCDLRGRTRTLPVLETKGDTAVVEVARGMYLEAGMRLQRICDGQPLQTGAIGPLPETDGPIILAAGDALRLGGPACLGRNAETDAEGRVTRPAQIGCTLPQLLDDVRVGQPVLFDDGKLAAVVERIEPAIEADAADSADVAGRLITLRMQRGGKLRGDKGINVPQTPLAVSALSIADLKALDVVVTEADLVGLSFVRAPTDVRELQRQIAQRAAQRTAAGRRRPLGVVLKIETRRACDELPELLLEGLKHGPIAVMIARGDLAVEVGFERLADRQEHILAIAQAAHVPTIWATQVLDRLSKKGTPTRAEITDADAGARADVVMLNKGPHVTESVRLLARLLTRAQVRERWRR